MKSFEVRLEILENSPNKVWYCFKWDGKPMRLREKFTSLIIEAENSNDVVDKILDLGKGTVKILDVEECDSGESEALSDLIMFAMPKQTKEVLDRTLTMPIGISNN